MSKLWFKKFETKEIFTKHIHLLMQNKTPFMMFIDNKQIMDNEKDIDEWILTHGISDNTSRVLGHYMKDKNGNRGYVITYSRGITNITIPNDLIALDYENFLCEIEK